MELSGEIRGFIYVKQSHSAGHLAARALLAALALPGRPCLGPARGCGTLPARGCGTLPAHDGPVAPGWACPVSLGPLARCQKS